MRATALGYHGWPGGEGGPAGTPGRVRLRCRGCGWHPAAWQTGQPIALDDAPGLLAANQAFADALRLRAIYDAYGLDGLGVPAEQIGRLPDDVRPEAEAIIQRAVRRVEAWRARPGGEP